MSEETKVDKVIYWFKNHPVFWIVLLIFIIIIAVGNLTGALQNIKNLVSPSEPPIPVVEVQFPGKEPEKCKSDSLPQKPFDYENSTKILIAVFEGGRQEAKEFGTDISMSIADRLHEYCKDSLDISVEDIEVVRLNCFVQSHSEAREILDSLGGDIFIWGNNFCALGSEEAKFCPKATLTRGVSPLEAIGKRVKVKEQLAITDLDLPSLTAERPYQLLNFIFGLHFYLRDKFKEAAVYFEKAGDEIYGSKEGAEYIYCCLAYTYHCVSKDNRALSYYQKALEMLDSGKDRWCEAMTLTNIAVIYFASGKLDSALVYSGKGLQRLRELRKDVKAESLKVRNRLYIQNTVKALIKMKAVLEEKMEKRIKELERKPIANETESREQNLKLHENEKRIRN